MQGGAAVLEGRGRKAGALTERVGVDLDEGVLAEVMWEQGRKTGASAERVDVTEILGWTEVAAVQ